MDLRDPSSLNIPFESVPVFPLPHTVLFPEQQLPLHIFESRYRQMVRDALEGAPFIVVARIDGDPSHEPTRFARVATVGRLMAHQRLADGRFNVLVEGKTRVLVEEIASPNLYRRVRATPLAEPLAGDPDARVASTDRAAMLALVGMVMQAARRRSPGMEFAPPTELPAHQLAFRIADRLVSDAAWRQRILEADTAAARVARTTEALAQMLGEIGGAEGPARTGGGGSSMLS